MSNASCAAAARTYLPLSQPIDSIFLTPPKPNGANVKDVWLYRLPQVLARLGISRSTWYDGISRGRFPASRLAMVT